MKHFKTVTRRDFKKNLAQKGCGECQNSCQSACKTSCTVANQVCIREEAKQAAVK